MPERELTPNVFDRITELYPTYMEMIRYFVNDDLIEADDPTNFQRDWARRASLSNIALEYPFACLAQASESAHKRRLLEGMPMLINLDGTMANDFEPIERFHFLRLFADDCRILHEYEVLWNGSSLPRVLQIEPLNSTDLLDYSHDS